MRRYENTWFKLAALVLTLVLIVPILAACGGGGDNSFEEERAEVVQYLQGYNNITISLSATLQGIDTPSSYWTVADILALKTALSQALTAVDGAMSRLNDLQPPSGVSEAVKHHQQAKTALTGLRQIFMLCSNLSLAEMRPSFSRNLFQSTQH
jgi:hypothetical protein